MKEDEIVHLGKLCRINLTDDEKISLCHNLDKILHYMEDLNGIDTDNVEPTHHVLQGMEHILAEDDVADLLDTKTFLKNAPDQIGGMVKVPPVIQF
ncbi:MAG: Asp-tRNA(Asn)/Glu-tRNA(Gln) amidotransferase subunit GatC [Chlamydiia bacterium]|nr:Asp-tRNA(Asn)/Glu-tRNA(Gln) amidotransferase subunit GatC [Chlamydiia bacterium]